MNLEFIFKIKVFIFWDKLNSPQNSTGKSGVQNCNPAAGGVRGGLLRLHLVLQGGVAQKGHLVTRITVTLSIFNFSTWFFAQIVENRGTKLSSPFLGPGDNFLENYDENQIWCAPARAPPERPWPVQSPRSCIRSHARGLARGHSDQIWFSS
jgi:hypothetical protein